MGLWTACSADRHFWIYVGTNTSDDPIPGTRCDCGQLAWKPRTKPKRSKAKAM